MAEPDATKPTEVGDGVRASTAPPPEPAPAATTEPEVPKGSGKDEATMEAYGLTSAQVAILDQSYLAGAPRVWQAVFMAFCKRRGFDAFARIMLNVQSPKIGLLNVGSEEMKGLDEVKEAHRILRNTELGLDFHGFVEGNDISAGTVDVVVTDGFTGNVALPP